MAPSDAYLNEGAIELFPRRQDRKKADKLNLPDPFIEQRIRRNCF